jgi:hypothetical protein
MAAPEEIAAATRSPEQMKAEREARALAKFGRVPDEEPRPMVPHEVQQQQGKWMGPEGSRQTKPPMQRRMEAEIRKHIADYNTAADRIEAEYKRNFKTMDPEANDVWRRRALEKLDGDFHETMLEIQTRPSKRKGESPAGRTRNTPSKLTKATPPQQQQVFVGPKAGPDVRQLIHIAETMEKQGATPEQIWKETAFIAKGELIGAFRGADGKWRVEMHDGRLELPPDGPGTEPVVGAIKAPHVEERYPGAIKHAAVKYTPQGERVYGYHHNGKIQVVAPGEKRARPIAAHELDHAVAAQEPGFDPGASPALFKDALPGIPDAVADKLYRANKGENLAEAAGKRSTLSIEERKARPPWLDESTPRREQIPAPPSASRAVESRSPAARRAAIARRRSDPVERAKGEELKSTLYLTSDPREARGAMEQLMNNETVPGDERTYFNELKHYLFRGNGVNPGNTMVASYFRLAKDRMNVPIPLKEFYQDYLRETKERSKLGYAKAAGRQEHYVKDYKSFVDHLLRYGKRIEESFGETPPKAAPWVVDEKEGVVYLSPYVPNATGARGQADLVRIVLTGLAPLA